MSTISVQEAQSRLSELIHQLKPGDEVVITENNHPIARLVAEPPSSRKVRQPGSAKGKLVINVQDDEHLVDFREYIE